MIDDLICVLMVEDQNDLCEMIGMVLCDFGIEVFIIVDGYEVVVLLKGDVCFDVVFSDVSMFNGMFGIEFSEYVVCEQLYVCMILFFGYVCLQLLLFLEQVEFLFKFYCLCQLVELFKQD